MSRVIGFIDIESTGLDWNEHRIIEFASQLYNLDSRSKIGEYEVRINPERSIDEKAQAVHGIAFEDLVGKATWPEVAPKVSKVLGACNVIVAHNGRGFDVEFIAHELHRVGARVPEFYLVDTMLEGRWATHDGNLPNLKALAFACGIPYDPEKAHAAMYDVDVMRQCFFAVLDRGFFRLPTTPWRSAKAVSA